MASDYTPGWDAKAISRIAKEHFGGWTQMFESHGWPERGVKMMPSVQRHVAETYGSILAFTEKYEPAGEIKE